MLGLLHTVTLPSPWALGGQHLTPFFLQGLLEERDNQVFFGEVGRQMVTGLMTRAEKVAGVGPLPPRPCFWLVFALFC